MIVGGCDIGSATGKSVIFKDGEIVAYSITPSTIKPEQTARQSMEEALEKAGLSSIDDLEYLVGTGYGRLKVGFARENVSEITCHAAGPVASPLHQDRGGYRRAGLQGHFVSDKGKVVEFAMNDKCAAGTGRFFEAMARTLHITLQELSTIGLESVKPVSLASQCSVFAESEVITMINEGAELPDIVAVSTTPWPAGWRPWWESRAHQGRGADRRLCQERRAGQGAGAAAEGADQQAAHGPADRRGHWSGAHRQREGSSAGAGQLRGQVAWRPRPVFSGPLPGAGAVLERVACPSTMPICPRSAST